jgi:hypothetical protein
MACLRSHFTPAHEERTHLRETEEHCSLPISILFSIQMLTLAAGTAAAGTVVRVIDRHLAFVWPCARRVWFFWLLLWSCPGKPQKPQKTQLPNTRVPRFSGTDVTEDGPFMMIPLCSPITDDDTSPADCYRPRGSRGGCCECGGSPGSLRPGENIKAGSSVP